MLTAKGSGSDVVAGLQLGAEDYITKPFSPRILVAHTHKVLRRRSDTPAEAKCLIQSNDLVIDIRKHEVTLDGAPVNLTYTEFEVLILLAGRPGWAFSRSQIVDSVRGYNYSATEAWISTSSVCGASWARTAAASKPSAESAIGSKTSPRRPNRDECENNHCI